VWLTSSGDNTVSRIDPASNRIIEVLPVGMGPVGATLSEGVLWVANEGAGTVSRIEA
jgi:YVTN family beta-propeller protein